MILIEKKIFYAAYSSIGFLLDEIKTKCDNLNFQRNDISEVCIIIDEMISNIIKYSYNNDKTKMFNLEIKFVDSYMIFIFEDSGEKFDLTLYDKIPEYDIEIENIKIGGLGIYFIKEYSDKIDYLRTTYGKNKVTIKKKIKV